VTARLARAWLPWIAGFALVSTHADARPAPPKTPSTLAFAARQVLVIVERDVLREERGSAVSRDARLAAALASLGLDRAHRVDPVPRAGGARTEEVWTLVSGRPDFDPIAASGAVQRTGAVVAAMPNYRIPVLSTVPNDPYMFQEWFIDDGGFADIRLPLAWDLERGDSSIAIAIVDTGVDTTHPDLASKIWHNAGEIPGNGIDDDGNGLIDDFEGWDFGTNDKDPKPEPTPEPFLDGTIDVGFHGTFCAGLAAAATNNDEGIASSGWNCKIMALKASNPDSGGITSDGIAGAVAYAADKGASVISMSFGAPGQPGVPEFFQALIDMATHEGSLCVAAAGNDGNNVKVYPAACERVLAVGATNSQNARASFSSYGSWVDVAAPGESMWSSICQNYTFSDMDYLYYEFFFNWDTFNPYMEGDGTSFSCPLTAGVCGLVRHRFPSLTPLLVAQHVIATGDVVAYDHPIGVKVNAQRALTTIPTAVEDDPSASRAPALVLAAAPNPTGGVSSIRFVLPAQATTRLSIFDLSGRRVRTLVQGTMTPGPHVVPWDGRDERGAPLAAGIYFARLTSGASFLSKKIVIAK